MFSESKIRYLEMIQKIITRLASNSFILKSLSVTLISALFVVIFNKCESAIILVFIIIISFWLLDSYYLCQERKYRKLYEKVIEIPNEEIDFDLNAAKVIGSNTDSYIESLLSVTEIVFYGSMLLVSFIITILLAIN